MGHQPDFRFEPVERRGWWSERKNIHPLVAISGDGNEDGVASSSPTTLPMPMMSPAVYKHYVLPLIFLRFLSLKYERRKEELERLIREPQSEYFTEDPDIAAIYHNYRDSGEYEDIPGFCAVAKVEDVREYRYKPSQIY